MIALLNTSILTSYGNFTYQSETLENIKEYIKNTQMFPEFAEHYKIKSFIGHQSTCDILTELFGFEVKMNREQFAQSKDDIAIVFKLNSRPEEGKILTREEIEAIGYTFGIIVNQECASLI